MGGGLKLKIKKVAQDHFMYQMTEGVRTVNKKTL